MRTIKLIILTLLFPTVLLLAFVPGIQVKEEKEAYVKIPAKYRDDIVNMLNQSVNDGYTVKCWTVEQSEKVLTAPINVVNYLKSLKIDSVVVKK